MSGFDLLGSSDGVLVAAWYSTAIIVALILRQKTTVRPFVAIVGSGVRSSHPVVLMGRATFVLDLQPRILIHSRRKFLKRFSGRGSAGQLSAPISVC